MDPLLERCGDLYLPGRKTRAMDIERVSPDDLTELLTETANAPMHMGAVLRLQDRRPAMAIRAALERRVAAVPRLRQRLVHTPVGLGRPIWVDHADFAIEDHVRDCVCSDPSDEVVLERAAAVVVEHLPRERPLWSTTLLTDDTGLCYALILVIHHVLADGIGGLAALTELVDGADESHRMPFPAPMPSKAALLADVARTRLELVGGIPALLRMLWDGVVELRGGQRRRQDKPQRQAGAPRTSLNRPIGPRRKLAVARVSLTSLVATAHRHDATINDLLLTGVAGALRRALALDGETVDSLVVSVPVSARRQARPGHLGNQVGVIPVTVPTHGQPLERLTTIAGVTRAGHHRQGRGASSAVLGVGFRTLARIGLFPWFINHQHFVNTFVTNVRGPDQPLLLLGTPISEITAMSPIAGNVTVAFAALSYAGSLTVTVIGDSAQRPDVNNIAEELQSQLDRLTSL